MPTTFVLANRLTPLAHQESRPLHLALLARSGKESVEATGPRSSVWHTGGHLEREFHDLLRENIQLSRYRVLLRDFAVPQSPEHELPSKLTGLSGSV